MSRNSESNREENVWAQQRSALMSAVFSYPEKPLVSAVTETARALAENEGDHRVGQVFLDFSRAAESAALRELEVEFNKVFVLKNPELCSARFWLTGEKDFRREHLLADVAGIYRAWGLQVDTSAYELPDHLSVMLEFLGYLFLKEAHAHNQGWQEKAQMAWEAERFFWQNYLGKWLPDFLEKAAELVEGEYFKTGIAAVAVCMQQLEEQLGGNNLEN